MRASAFISVRVSVSFVIVFVGFTRRTFVFQNELVQLPGGRLVVELPLTQTNQVVHSDFLRRRCKAQPNSRTDFGFLRKALKVLGPEKAIL